MSAVIIVAIVFGGVIIALTIIATTILTAMRLRHGEISPKGKQHQADEAGMIQEIYQGLEKMEARVESLETILMDQKKKDRCDE